MANASTITTSNLQTFIADLAPAKALPAPKKIVAAVAPAPATPPVISASVGGANAAKKAAVNSLKDVQTVAKLLLSVGVDAKTIPQDALDGKKLTAADTALLITAIRNFQNAAERLALAFNVKNNTLDKRLMPIMLQPSIFGGKRGDGRIDVKGATFPALTKAAALGWKIATPTVVPKAVAAVAPVTAVKPAVAAKPADVVAMPSYLHGIGEYIENTRGGEAMYQALGIGTRDDGTANLGLVSAFKAPSIGAGIGEFASGLVKAPVAVPYAIVDNFYHGVKSLTDQLGEPLKTFAAVLNFVVFGIPDLVLMITNLAVQEVANLFLLPLGVSTFKQREAATWRAFIESDGDRQTRLDAEEASRLQNEEQIDTQNLSGALVQLNSWGELLTHIAAGQSALQSLQQQLAAAPKGSAQAVTLQTAINNLEQDLATSQKQSVAQAQAMLGPTQQLASAYDALSQQELFYLAGLSNEFSQPLSAADQARLEQEALTDFVMFMNDASADLLVNTIAGLEQQYVSAPGSQPSISDKLQALATKIKAARSAAVPTTIAAKASAAKALLAQVHA